MIDNQVTKAAQHLIDRCAALFSDQPQYQLDQTWPSISTVNLLLAAGIGRGILEEEENELLNQAASYLGVFTYGMLSKIQNPPRIELVLNRLSQVILTVHEAQGEPRSINISELANIAVQNSQDLPVFPPYKRIPRGDHNSLSAAALTVLLRSRSCSPEELIGSHLPAVERLLVKSAADFYRRIHPNEGIGQDKTLYLANLIFPVNGFEHESLPSDVGASLAEHLAGKGYSPAQIAALGQNLAESPDETISLGGFVLAAAAVQGFPADDLRYLSITKTAYRPSLRLAIAKTRKILGLEDDWFDWYRDGAPEKATIAIRKELALGLLPLWRMPLATLRSRELGALFESIAANDLEKALEFCSTDKFAPAPLRPVVLIQRAFLELKSGAFDKLRATVIELETVEIAAGDEADALRKELLGIIALAQGEYRRAAELLAQAYSMYASDQQKQAEVRDALVHALVSLDQPIEALKALAIQEQNLSFVSRFRYASILLLAKQIERAQNEITRLLKIPDARVFSLRLALEKIRNSQEPTPPEENEVQ